ncbi:Chromo domain-containing protein 1 [Pseudocercospora fuligena]|uniref:Chromo domain-containing protein 1 n=1 Tax=Pseudocercospora fuligena TaxID=685502 RepID=A0A8H6VJU9_9PEZI|nr:Chromo domain-containing protein 1 [Pseudocercospora fuligena]
MGALFRDESDTDSINTTSTVLSEEQDVYEVENVLAEERSIDDGVMRYLIKWAGYPLSQSTWEPIDNIQGEEIMKQWSQHKQLVREGKVKPFNVDDFDAAVEEDLAIKDEKNRRRKAKKRKRGIPVSSDEEDEEDVGVSRQSTPPQQRPTKRLKASSPARRKGVAQKLAKSRAKRQSSVSSSEESSNEAESSGGDSLAEELASRSESSRVKRRSPTKSSASTTTAVSIPARPVKRPALVANPTPAPQATRPISKPAEKTKTIPTTARKSAPSTVAPHQSLGTAKRTSNKNIMSNWDADAKQRKRRAAGDGAPSGFRNLKHQNNSLNFRGAERAPDIQSLVVLDPKTGRPVAPKLATAEATSRPAPQAKAITPVDPSGNIQAAYGRRTPPPAARQRTVTPPSPDPVSSIAPPNDAAGRRASAAAVPSGAIAASSRPQLQTSRSASSVHTSNLAGPPIPLATSTSSGMHDAYSRRAPAPMSQQRPPSPPPDPRSSRPGDDKWQIETCKYWLAGNCLFDERSCKFAHWHIAEKQLNFRHVPNKQKTCYFWKRGGCRKSEEQCNYAHRDTGIDAWAPGQMEPAAKDNHMPNNPSSGQLPAKAVTCYYWKHETCNKPVGDCKFEHYDTGVVALPPGGFKKGSRQSDGLNANEIPLGVRPTEAFSSVTQYAQAPLHIPAANAISVAQQPSTDPRLRQARVSTDMQTAHRSEALPMECTMSPAHIGNDTMNQGHDGALSRVSSIRVDSAQRRPSLPTVTVKAMLSLLFAPNNHPISDHVKLETSETEELARVAGKEPTLRVESVVMAADVEDLLWEEKIRPLQHTSGGIAPYTVGDVDALTDLCKLHACGLIARPDGYSSTMLIYPSNAEEWKFFDQDSPSVSTECVLRFRVFQQLSALDFTSLESLPDLDSEKPQHVARIGKDLAMLDRDTFLHGDIRTVFLMIPPGDELDVYRAYFHDLECKVYHSATPGAWEYFKKKNQKLAVFLHASVPVWRVPDLHPFLASNSATFFLIGHDPLATPAELDSFDRSWTRLFPLGTILFITDEILVYRPEKATEIISAYNSAHKHKPEGGEFSKIATRPGLKSFLSRLASQTSDARYNELYKAVCTLCPPADEDEDGSGNPLLDSNLISVNPDLLPSFEGKWEKDPAAATNFMVDWFAGWSALNAARYRKFMVCYEASKDGEVGMDPAGWTSKYQHIGVVSTQQAIAQFYKARDKKR